MIRTAVFCLFCCLASASRLLPAQTVDQGPRRNTEAAAVEDRFQRVYAPADRLRDWPFGNHRYVPVEPEDFQRLVKTVQDAVAGRMPVRSSQITSATYAARLRADGSLGGTATLSVENNQDVESLLDLEPFSPAITEARWQTPSERPATLGVDVDQRLVVLVDRAGDLRLDWTLVGETDTDGAMVYDIELPRCWQSRMTLNLPAGTNVSVDRGVVLPSPAAYGDERAWHVSLAGGGRCHLRLTDQQTTSAPKHRPLVRQSTTYQMWPHGVDVSVGLELNARQQPLGRLRFSLDPDCRVVAARMGTTALEWSITTDKETETSQLTVMLPDETQGAGSSLNLAVVFPLELDDRWRLPSIRPLDAIWEEGEMTLLVPESLSLNAIFVTDCRQTRVGHLGSPAGGESHVFQCYSTDAALEVVIAGRRPRTNVLSGTAVELSDTAAARVVADLRVTDGEVYSLKADVGAGWIIDAVDSLPADVLDDWTSELDETGARQLSILFDRPLKEDRPVRLVIAGRRLGLTPPGTLPIRHLVPLEFRDVAKSRTLLSARLGAGRAIEADSAAFSTLDHGDLTPEEAALFESISDEYLFDVETAAPEDGITVVAKQPAFHATVGVDVDVTNRRLTEHYAIRCVSDSAPIRSLVVRFSQVRAESLSWTSITDGAEPLVARKWTAREAASAGYPTNGEIWEVSLGRPRSGPIEISASRATTLLDRMPVNLASLPRALRQQATVAIRSTDGTPVDVDQRGLTPIPSDPPRDDEYNTVVAMYRYQPADVAGRNRSPALLLSVLPQSAASPRALVWDAGLTSQYGGNRTAEHNARFRIENGGQEGVVVTIPAGGKAVRFVMDGEPIDHQPVTDGMFVALPAGRRYVTLDVAFLTECDTLGSWEQYQAPFPRIDLPTIVSHWRVWLPPGYEMLRDTRQWTSLTGRTWSLSQRLLGPLGREPAQRPFDPTSAVDWRQATAAFHQRQLIPRAEDFLRSLGDQLAVAARSDAQGFDWKRLINALPSARNSSTTPLLIDAGELADLGIGPRTQIVPRDWDDRTLAGASLLSEVDLVLLIAEKSVVITSTRAASMLSGTTSWLPGLPAAGQSLDSISRNTISGNKEMGGTIGSGKLIPAVLWSSVEESSRDAGSLPWASGQPTSHYSADRRGWSTYLLVGSAEKLPTITVMDRHFWRISGSATFLVVATFGWWLSAGRRRILWPMAGVVASVALALPEPLVPAGAGAVLAVLACLAIRLWTPASDTRKSAAYVPGGAGSSIRKLIVTGRGWIGPALFIAAFLAASSTAAQDDRRQAMRIGAPPPLYRVFIPVDDEREPTGQPYHVPEPLLRSLRSRAAAAKQEPRGWTANSAVYRASIDSLPSADSEDGIVLGASIDLSVLESGQRVIMPLERKYLADQESAISLDGKLLDVEWQADNRGFSFPVAEAGDYRLQLSLRGVSSTVGSTHRWDTAAIPAAQARLILDVPPGVVDIDITTARGGIKRERPRRRLIAQLGRGDRIRLQWPTNVTKARVEQPFAVDELLWLRILPGSVVLDAKLTFSTEGRSAQTVRISADPRLRPRPGVAENPRISNVHWISTEEFTGFEYQLKPYSGNDPLIIQTSLQLTDTSPVGRQRIPYFEPPRTKSSRRLVAVSIDPLMETDGPTPGTWEAIDIADFASGWGETDNLPDYAFQVGQDRSDWGLATRPQPRQVTCRQRLAIGVGSRRHEVRLRASVSTAGGASFSHRIAVPPELRIQRVAVLQEGAQRAERWARDDTGAVTVFLNGPTTGPWELEIDGWLPAASRGAGQVPDMRLESDATSSRIVEIYRRPFVMVHVETSAATIEDVGHDDQDPVLGQFVAAFDLTGRSDPLNLVVKGSRPRTRAVETTVMRRRRAAWNVEIDYRLSVTDGVLDSLWLLIPPELTGQLEIDPPLPHTLESPDDNGRRRLVINPYAPIEGEFQLVVRAPLSLRAGDDIHVPHVAAASFQRSRRIVILPIQFDSSFALWETSGLTPIGLPADFVPAPATAESFQAYRAIQSRYGAVLRSLESLAGVPRVRLADYHVAWSPDGAYRGLAAFDVEPAATNQGMLRMPAGCRPLQITVERIHVLGSSDEKGLLPVRFTSDQLPQHVEVLFEGRRSVEQDDLTEPVCVVPVFDAMPVMQSLWTVTGPPASTFASIATPEGLSAIEQQLLRLESIDAMIHGAARSAGSTTGITPDTPAHDIARWYPAWARRARAAHGSLLRATLPSNNPGEHVSAQTAARAIVQQQESLASEVLNAGEIWTQVQQEMPRASQELALWGHHHRDHTMVLRGGVAGPVEVIPALSLGSRSNWFGRYALALALLLAGIAGGTRLGRPMVEAMNRWPAAAGVAVGIGWWLWLSPSVLGWLIIAVSLILPAWPLQRKSQALDTGSSVIRIGST